MYTISEQARAENLPIPTHYSYISIGVDYIFTQKSAGHFFTYTLL